jgi:hypothetical protein
MLCVRLSKEDHASLFRDRHHALLYVMARDSDRKKAAKPMMEE